MLFLNPTQEGDSFPATRRQFLYGQDLNKSDQH
jgi:hypothetical protein